MIAVPFGFQLPAVAVSVRPTCGADTVVPPVEVERVVSKLRTQKGIVIDHEVVEGASHFWAEHLPEVEKRVGAYLDKRIEADPI